MNIQTIIKDARDPNSKDNTFRLFWAMYLRTANHIQDRNILCFPMKVLEANVTVLSRKLGELRKAEDDKREGVAQEVLDLVEKSKATMEQLLKL